MNIFLVFCSIENEVNVEREGGGDSEGEVGDHGDPVHPGGPGELLGYPARLSDGLQDLPEGGHQADAVTRHNDDHNVDRHPRDQHLPLPDQRLENISRYFLKGEICKKTFVSSLLR